MRAVDCRGNRRQKDSCSLFIRRERIGDVEEATKTLRLRKKAAADSQLWKEGAGRVVNKNGSNGSERDHYVKKIELG